MKTTALIIIVSLLLTGPSAIGIYAATSERGNVSTPAEVPLDSQPPVSGMGSEPIVLIPSAMVYRAQKEANIWWWGDDRPIASGYSGIDHFEVQFRYSIVQGPGIPELMWPMLSEWRHLGNFSGQGVNTTSFEVSEGLLYQFRCRAVDKVGNAEDWPEEADSTTLAVGLYFGYYEMLMELKEDIGERIDPNEGPGSEVLPLKPITLCLPNGVPWPNQRGTYGIPPADSEPFPRGHDLADMIAVRRGLCDMGFEVEWTKDEDCYCGDVTVDVQYRETSIEALYIDEGLQQRAALKRTDWTEWITDSSEDSAYFEVSVPGLYEFRSRAKNLCTPPEQYPMKADAWTVVIVYYDI